MTFLHSAIKNTKTGEIYKGFLRHEDIWTLVPYPWKPIWKNEAKQAQQKIVHNKRKWKESLESKGLCCFKGVIETKFIKHIQIIKNKDNIFNFLNAPNLKEHEIKWQL